MCLVKKSNILKSNTYFFIKPHINKFRFGYLPSGGRSFTGRITVRHRSAGNKIKSYKIDFYRRINAWGWLMKIIKTSHYSSYIGLILYQNGLTSLILLSEHCVTNRRYYSGTAPLEDNSLYWGNAQSLQNAKLFSLVHSLELLPYKGMQYVRAAGTYCLLAVKLSNNKCLLKLKSGWNIIISQSCMCVLGKGSNSQHMFKRLMKAGVSRALGRRPCVRGVAMNSSDHPHGGGEGKKSGSAAARSPWGWLTKGTPSNKKTYQLDKKRKFKQLRK